MKLIFLTFAICTFTTTTLAATLPFDVSITGKGFDVHKQLELSDLNEGKTKADFYFKDTTGKTYSFALNYKSLPPNRSYPGNLDITLKDSNGNKLGYLFFAINGVGFLKQMGTFGLIVDINGEPADLKFVFDSKRSGSVSVSDLEHERLVLDTIVPKFGFQMIRPMLLPLVQPGIRSQSYSLDYHPYEVNYTIRDIKKGLVEFQFNLYKKNGMASHLLERIYFNADSINTLREGMFAGKYFDKNDGSFKLVFYPTLGQTSQ